MKYADLIKDKEEYIERFKKYIFNRKGGENLLGYIVNKTDFFTAPASTKYHMSTAGGLCRHSLNVDDALCELMFTPGTIWNQYAIDKGITRETVAVVALLHDICKTNFFVEGAKNQKTYDPVKVAAAPQKDVKRDARGEYIWESIPVYEIEDKCPFGHGEKSAYIVGNYIHLSLDELLAIRWHMGFSAAESFVDRSPLNCAMVMSPLVLATHLADITATHLMEEEKNGYEVKKEISKAEIDGVTEIVEETFENVTAPELPAEVVQATTTAYDDIDLDELATLFG